MKLIDEINDIFFTTMEIDKSKAIEEKTDDFAIDFMCWCEENKGWINSYSNKEKLNIFKKERE
jgi:hypothetical protein